MPEDQSAAQQNNREFSIEAVGKHVGAYVVIYDPYRVEDARKQIAKYDTSRMVDAPDAKVVVLIPTMRMHIESGNRVDVDVLRHGVDVVCVYDSDSARRLNRALNDSGVKVVLMPRPKVRDLMNFNQLSDRQKIPGLSAALQTMFDVTPAEARAAATKILEEKAARRSPAKENPEHPRQ